MAKKSVQDLILERLDKIDNNLELLLADFNMRRGAKKALLAIYGIVAGFIGGIVSVIKDNLIN